ncbi:RHS repeat-associated core domain-containing protein [Delftia tsuruhatensis]
MQISGAASASYTYDANGNRLTQAQTKGVVTSTTSYHWNAQDQLIRVDQDYSSGAQTLAQYRYNAGNLRAEKFLSNAGLNKATQGRTATYSPLAYERIQWDGLHARRSFEISGADNRQTLHSDTDAAVLAGNTAPWLFNRTQYANGLGSTSSTTQLHADSNGNLVATVASEGGTAKADSLLLYSAYGSVDSEASGNAGTGIRSNGHSFGSYYADPETGLLYARARYYDPASGQFISRDPVEGEARLPLTWGAYQYGRYNPYRYVDPNGEQSTSTLIDNAAEGCGRFTCALYALGKGLYVASTLGFASVHDPMRDAYDEGKISQGQYWGAGVGGGLAVAGLNVATGAAGGALVGAASSTAGRVAVAAVVGASSGAAGDAATQAAHMGGGIQSGYDLQQTATSAAVGGALGAGSVPLANAIKSSLDRRTVARALAKELQTTEPVLAAKTPSADVEAVLPKLNDATPKLVAEKDALVASPQTQPAVKTVQARRGEVNGSTSLVENNTVRILGAKCPNSGRNFEPENAGGVVRELNTNRVKVTERGIGVVEKHLARFGQDDSNDFMISRLKSISNGKIPAEQVDLNFYTHELREYVRYRRLGWEKGVPSSSDEAYRLWNNTHTATLEDYGLNEKMIPNPLYHKDAP